MASDAYWLLFGMPLCAGREYFCPAIVTRQTVMTTAVVVSKAALPRRAGATKRVQRLGTCARTQYFIEGVKIVRVSFAVPRVPDLHIFRFDTLFLLYWLLSRPAR